MLKQKLEELGFKFSDTYGASSGYLLEDGSFLNLQYQEPLHSTDRVYHGMLDRYIQRNNLIENLDKINYKSTPGKRPRFLAPGNDRLLRYTDNACTLNNGAAFMCEGVFIDLPPVMPKGKQLEQLTLWIDNLHYANNHKNHLDVSLEDEIRHFHLDEDSTDDIIKEIKKLYNIMTERKE